jgi:hypothetical protein
MTDQEKFEAIERGIAFPSDRSRPPAICFAMPTSETQFKGLAVLNYEQIDALITAGDVIEHEYHGFTSVRLSYQGARKLLEATGFDLNKFSQRLGNCCDKAIPRPCVCRIKTMCPEHGLKCHGSHD